MTLGDGAGGGVGSARRIGRSDGEAGGFETSGRGPSGGGWSAMVNAEATLGVAEEGMEEEEADALD